MPEIITAYYDRQPRTIEGFFTIQIFDPKKGGYPRKLFEKMPARSGQQPYADTSDVTAKSPIPFGEYRLYIDTSLSPKEFPKTPGGIGEFFSIGSETSKRIIIDKKSGKTRQDVGLHPENSFNGSAGCIVLVHDSPAKKAAVIALFEFFRQLGKTQSFIDLKVL